MDNALNIANRLEVEVRDGLFYVADLVSVDGSPWVTQAEFISIVDTLLVESDSVEILEAILGPSDWDWSSMLNMFDD